MPEPALAIEDTQDDGGSLNSIDEIIEDLRHGRMVIMLDDEDRENEGDLVMAAPCVRPEDINFMARYGRGLICLTLTEERCRRLRLPLMVNDNNTKHATNFTVSVEAAQGVTTGISAADRAMTVQAAVALDAKPEDLVQPGHIFPLKARDGGVLTRAGHTEAGCDLARLAGFEPAAVIVEILNEDGTMARRPDLEAFAEQHGLKMGTVADLIRYRLANEKSVERVAECEFPTEYGDFRLVAFEDVVDREVHFALVRGTVSPDQPTLVRVHVQDTLADTLRGQLPGLGWSLSRAMARLAQEDNGILVVLRRQQSAAELVHWMRDQEMLRRGARLPHREQGPELRTYGIGAQILADLGVRRMRVLGTPRRMHGLAGFDLEVDEYLPYE